MDNLSRPAKIAIGAFSVCPLVSYIILLVVLIFRGALNDLGWQPIPETYAFLFFSVLVISWVSIAVLFLIFLIDIIATGRLTREEKELWGVVIFFGCFVTIPLYFYFNVWKPRARDKNPTSRLDDLNKSARVSLGLLTIWPAVVFILINAALASGILPENFSAGSSSLVESLFLGLMIATLFEAYALIALYIVHLFRTRRVPDGKKPFWAAAIFFFNVLAMPIFYFFYIWKPAPLEPMIEEVS